MRISPRRNWDGNPTIPTTLSIDPGQFLLKNAWPRRIPSLWKTSEVRNSALWLQAGGSSSRSAPARRSEGCSQESPRTSPASHLRWRRRDHLRSGASLMAFSCSGDMAFERASGGIRKSTASPGISSIPRYIRKLITSTIGISVEFCIIKVLHSNHLLVKVSSK